MATAPPSPSMFELEELWLHTPELIARPNWHLLVNDQGHNVLMAALNHASPSQLGEIVGRAVAEGVLDHMMAHEDPNGVNVLAYIVFWWTGDHSVEKGAWTELLMPHKPPALNRAGKGILWQCQAYAAAMDEGNDWLADHPILNPDQVKYLTLHDWIAGFEDQVSEWCTNYLVRTQHLTNEHEMVYFLMGQATPSPQGEGHAQWPPDLLAVWDMLYVYEKLTEAWRQDRKRFEAPGGFVLPESLHSIAEKVVRHFQSRVPPDGQAMRAILNTDSKEDRWSAFVSQLNADAIASCAPAAKSPLARRSL